MNTKILRIKKSILLLMFYLTLILVIFGVIEIFNNSILHIGNTEKSIEIKSVTLERTLGDNGIDKALFSFDNNSFTHSNITYNDILLNFAGITNVFLTFSTINNAKMYYINDDRFTGHEIDNSIISICEEERNKLIKGGSTIPEVGSFFCWETNMGKLVVVRVSDVINRMSTYFVTIEYVVVD